MNCKEFRTLMGETGEAEIPAGSQAGWETHLLSCVGCLEFYAGKVNAQAGEAAQITASIVSATAGNPCEEAENLLVRIQDEDHSFERKRLLDSHLTHCEACRNLKIELELLAASLPALRSATPPPGLLAEILDRTVSNETAPMRAGIGLEFLRQLIRRPRFSLEASFVLTVTWMLIFGLPTGTFTSIASADQTPIRNTLESARTSLDAELQSLTPRLRDNLDTLGELGDGLFHAGSRSLERSREWGDRIGASLLDWLGGQSDDAASQDDRQTGDDR